MSATSTNSNGSPRLDRAGVSAVVDAWLPAGVEGADAVRAAVARRLAIELDDPDLPAHALGRLASTLVSVVSALDDKRSVSLDHPPTRAQLSQLLDVVNGRGVRS